MSILQSEQLWEPSPSYTQFLSLSRKFVSDNVAQLMSNYTFPQDTVKDLNRCLTNLHRNDYALMFVLTIFWAITRHMLTKSFFKVSIIHLFFSKRKNVSTLPCVYECVCTCMSIL